MILEKFQQYLAVNNFHNEWFLSNFEELLLKDVSSANAYLLIPEAVLFCLDSRPKELEFSDAFEILLSLVGRSDTTQVPTELKDNLRQLEEEAEKEGSFAINQFNELKRWYRLS